VSTARDGAPWQTTMKLVKAILDLLKETFEVWQRDGAILLGAAISFYAALSLAPLLIFAVVFAGTVYGAEAAESELVTQTEEIAGPDVAVTIGDIVYRANLPRQGVFATVVALLTLLFGASNVFWQIKRALNTAWGIRHRPNGRMRGVLGIIRGRALAFAMVFGACALLLVSLALDTSLSALRRVIAEMMPHLTEGLRLLYALQGLKFLLSFALLNFAVAVIYKVLPDAEVAWKDVSIGAAVTTLLLSGGNLVIGWYLANRGVGSAYGTAGSLLAFLVWVYFSALVFFFGAEFTRVYANKYGSWIIPGEDTLLIVHQQHTLGDLLRGQLGPGELNAPQDAMVAAEVQPEEERAKAGRESKIRRYGGAVAAVAALAVGVFVGVRRIGNNAEANGVSNKGSDGTHDE
jgi:membrane protein